MIAGRVPIPVLGIDSDNDSAFISQTLIDYCQQRDIEFTRSRAYRSNDQAFIEQKNGAVIRRFAGYERFAGFIAGQTLARLFALVGLYTNFFQPSFKADLQAALWSQDPKALRPSPNSLPATARSSRCCRSRSRRGCATSAPNWIRSSSLARSERPSRPWPPWHRLKERMARCKRMIYPSSWPGSLTSGAKVKLIPRGGQNESAVSGGGRVEIR